MKEASDFEMKNDIKNDLNYTNIGAKPSKRKTFLTKTLKTLVEDIQNKAFDELIDNSDDLQGQGIPIIIPSNIFDTHTRLEFILGVNLSGHTKNLPGSSNLIDDLYKKR